MGQGRRVRESAAGEHRISGAQTVAATVMSLPAAFAFAGALATVLPVAPIHAIFLAGLTLPLVWVGLIVWAFLARSARRAWLGAGAITLASGGLIGLHLLQIV